MRIGGEVMKKKTSDFFDNFTLSEVATKLLSSKKIQPVLNKTFEQMMKLKSRLDAVMPLALGILNMPSLEDIKKLNSEITKLNLRLNEVSKKSGAKRKVKRKKAAKKANPTIKASQKEIKEDTAPQSSHGTDTL